MGWWARRLMAVAAPVAVCLSAGVLAGCGDFWQAPNSGSTAGFSLSNGGAITVSPGSTSTATITVTPGSAFTGTVTLTCGISKSPSGASNIPTCSFSSSSLTFSSATAQTATLTAAAAANTTTGAYQLTVTGVSGSTSETTTFCVAVGSSTSSCSSAAGTSGDFYILNSSTISGYYINAGTLTALSGSPYTLPSGIGTPTAMAIDPTGTLLYVATQGGIFLYPIGSGGALPATPTTISQAGAVAAIQVDPSGKWLLAAYSIGTLNAFPITAKGTLVSDSSQLMQLAGTPIQMTISPTQTNAIVAVALGSSGTQVFPFASGSAAPIGNAYTPTIAPYGANITSTATAESVATDPQNRFLYIGEVDAFPNSTASTGTGGLRVLTISSTGASEIASSPYPSGGTGPHVILPESSGNYVYVANWAGNATGAGFQVASTGALTQLSSTFTTGSEPTGLAEDNTDGFVLVVSGLGSPDFDAYSFSSSTGSLTSGIPSNSTGTGPVAIVAVPAP
jgi:6-phosphogluconolactonase (cycloisomerase 2 family)